MKNPFFYIGILVVLALGGYFLLSSKTKSNLSPSSSQNSPKPTDESEKNEAGGRYILYKDGVLEENSSSSDFCISMQTGVQPVVLLILSLPIINLKFLRKLF